MEALVICVVLLGSPSFRTREAAQQRLVKLDSISLPALLAGESHSDPEIASRCTSIIGKWYERHALEILERHLPKSGKWPWMAWLDVDDSWSYNGIMGSDGCYYRPQMELLRSQGNFDGGPEWPLWREGARLHFLDQIRQRRGIRYELLMMQECEARWRAKNAP